MLVVISIFMFPDVIKTAKVTFQSATPFDPQIFVREKKRCANFCHYMFHLVFTNKKKIEFQLPLGFTPYNVARLGSP